MEAVKSSEASSWRDLQSAIKSGDAMSVRKAIISWAGVTMNKQGITSLQALGDTAGAEQLKPHLQQLDQYLYKGGKEVNFTELDSAMNDFKKKLAEQKKNNVSSADELAPLYPQ